MSPEETLADDRGPAAAGAVERVVDAITDVGAALAGLGIVALMLLTAWNVILRITQRGGVAGAVELSEVVLAGIAFLAIPYALKEGEHVSTAVLAMRLPPKVARALLVVGALVALGVVGWSAWVAWPQALSSMESGEARMGLTRIAVWPGRMVAAAGLTLTAAQLVLSIVDVARGQRDEL